MTHRHYAYLDSESDHVRSFPTGRVCACGTILSRYNSGSQCSTCAKPDAATMRLDMSRQVYDNEVAKLRRQHHEDAMPPPKPKHRRKPRPKPATVTDIVTRTREPIKVINARALDAHFARSGAIDA